MAGQERYRALSSAYFRLAGRIIFVYDVTNQVRGTIGGGGGGVMFSINYSASANINKIGILLKTFDQLQTNCVALLNLS